MKIINSMSVDKDNAYEPPYSIMWGVNDETTDTRVMTMQRTIIPPGGKNKMHTHTCDAVFYVNKGPIYVYCGDPGKPRKDPRRGGAFLLRARRRAARAGEPERDRARRAHRHLRELFPPGQGGHDLRAVAAYGVVENPLRLILSSGEAAYRRMPSRPDARRSSLLALRYAASGGYSG